MGDLIQFPGQDPAPERRQTCSQCGWFALSNNGHGFCTLAGDETDLDDACEDFTWPG